tara:strand:- start:1105 stop:1260 length:156 start_codon:yes stop_codon:yes gene_type:complete
MNWRKVNIKKNFIPIVIGALAVLAVGTLIKSYKGREVDDSKDNKDKKVKLD